ncbi:SDR family NAD(P)-dependent oxidoreductase [Burkholderiaceae bacterium DAT-1]|nr:SDR family NAD(P)-dependent oxidoreductase [Burkholderiaceae bacterium DAT-1]
MKLAGRKVLVTGGTAGIGEALTTALLARGCKVIICGRQQDALDRAGATSGVFPMKCDLSSADEVITLATRIAAEHGDLSLIINNAGVQHEFDIMSTAADRVQFIAELETRVNFLAPVLINKLLIDVLATQESAAIVNVTTPLALSPKKSSPLYCASKAALRSYTKALRYQLAASCPGIRVVEVQPPLVDTAMTRGRGQGKISPHAAAAELLERLEAGQHDIYIGKARWMKHIHRWLPGVAESITKRW